MLAGGECSSFGSLTLKFPFPENYSAIVDVCVQSLIDDAELESIQSTAAHAKGLVEAGNYEAAFTSFGRLMGLVDTYAHGIDFYNFLVFRKLERPVNKRTPLRKGEYSL